MGILKRLFSSPDVVAETAKSAIKGLDDIVYTDQEKAEKTQIAQELYARMWEAAVPSALSRRIIASVIVAVWAFCILFGLASFALETYLGQTAVVAEFAFRVLAEIVLQPMNIVVGFYFLKQIVTEYRK